MVEIMYMYNKWIDNSLFIILLWQNDFIYMYSKPFHFYILYDQIW
jgi:hypothetical protein